MLYDIFLKPYESYSLLFIILEAIAAVFGIMSVWYARRNSILVYPTGIISTAMYVYILFVGGVYGDAVINIYYTAMSVYGWYTWAHMRCGEEKMPITLLGKKTWAFTVGFTAGNFCLLGHVSYGAQEIGKLGFLDSMRRYLHRSVCLQGA